MTPDLAQQLWRYLEPLHAMIYFAPEAEEEFTKIGLRPGRMCYFAGRSAPMGAVGPGVVAATFYNFNPELVAKHIPRAWTLASPEDVVAARFRAADTALGRLLGDDVVGSADLAEAARLVRRAAEGASGEARPLYAGHADLEWPEVTHLVLWHAISLLREFRGDGHVTALLSAELTGLESLITHTATGEGFVVEFAQQSRGWSPEQWSTAYAGLVERGILDEAGSLTGSGESLRQEVETHTDRLALQPWRQLTDEDAERLSQLGKQLARTVSKADAFPSGIFTTTTTTTR
ncbi:MAG: SCO6745 family protein [Sciscionella sp.]